eukprot:CAMPEP_0180321552 /NCGR_PEP_ID=MMETSP0988-20121125/36205_1 /TAXON_ID=697907 /ORGANISM="non described non described, Strain CCMP2293" /LENGTH=72 /DNA_ID=CAMNT_0022307429 /DNA_START=1 /DNA_END=216 /DNA_ORIENTATION=+
MRIQELAAHKKAELRRKKELARLGEGLNKENQAIWKNFLHQGTLDQQSLEHRILTYPEHAVEAGSTSAPPAS